MGRIGQIASASRYELVDDLAEIEEINVGIEPAGRDGWYPSLEQAMDLVSDMDANLGFIAWLLNDRDITTAAWKKTADRGETHDFISFCLEDWMAKKINLKGEGNES